METTQPDSVADEARTVKALAALAQPQRLRAFRALVVAFHLKELANAGLVSSEPRGRYLIYRANFAQMNALLGYLTQHCCEGQACELTESANCINC